MKLICANFKMNLLKKDILAYLDYIKDKSFENVIFFPSVIYIENFKKENYEVGAQDISFKEIGSITGDLSALQLKEMGISYTIIGHSERRKYFNDDNNIKDKINIAISNNLKVILCIGENNNENMETTINTLKKQIDDAINKNLNIINNNNLIIAYEPVWSIGSGIIPDNKTLKETINWIKNYLDKTYDLNLKVLYGGSVNLENIDELNKLSEIDGYLIGGACLNPEKFINLVNKIK